VKTPIVELIEANPGTIDSVLKSLRELNESLRTDSQSWENPTLERYLEAMERWLTALKDRVADKPCWELFALMLEAAKDYE
jgi:hypothetical protein